MKKFVILFTIFCIITISSGFIWSFLVKQEIIVLSREVIFAKYDRINPTLSEEELKELDENSGDYNRNGTIYVPGSLTECFTELEKRLSPDDIEKIKSEKEEDLYKYHTGLGLWIRNAWLRGDTYKLSKIFLNMGIRHIDDMSGFIIKGFYHYLNEEDFDEEEYIYQYKKRIVLASY